MSATHLGVAEAPPEEHQLADFGRVPPHDLLAEQSVLGAMLLSKDAAAEVTGMLNPKDFYLPKHETIYEAILTLYAAGDPTDVITVTDHLIKTGKLRHAGHAEYLHTLTSVVPTAANATFYAEIVTQKSLLRRLVTAGTRITQMGYTGEGEAADLVNTAQTEIYSITDTSHTQDYVPLVTAATDAYEEIEKARRAPDHMLGVPTGFTELDEKTNGFSPGQMIIVAARPAMGKSTLALDIARHAAIREDTPTLFFSLEMGRTEIALRLFSAESSINLQAIRKGDLSHAQFVALQGVQSSTADTPLFIDDSPNLTLVEIRAKCRRLKQQQGLGLVVIDYLQLLTSGKKVESRQQEVSEFSRSLKLLAKELDIPVVALSQLNRASEQRADKKPAISDLRESGSLEQDADIVILLHRETITDHTDPRAGEADLILAKQRNGPTGTITVSFQGHLSRFSNMP